MRSIWSDRQNRKKLYTKFVTYLNYATALGLFLFLTYCESSIYLSKKCNELRTINLPLPRFDYIFFLLGVLYMVTSISILVLVRKYYSQYYQDHGCMILTATFFLTVPLLLGGLSLYFYENSQVYKDYVTENTFITYPVHVFFASLIPVVTQIFTLVFGFTRLKSEKEQQFRT